MPTLLTIAIPTFNRPALLQACVAELLSQIIAAGAQEKIEVLVIDNASSPPASFEHAPSWLTCVRNSFNVGGNANILRCFERCQSPWLWIIGDDDMPEAGAVKQALDSICAHPQAIAINHAVRHQANRTSEWTCTGIDNTLSQLDAFGNLLFLPSTLYRIAPLLCHLDRGYHYAYSCAPHLVLLFSALTTQDADVVFLPTSNIAYERPQVENRGWIIPITHGLPVLLELPLPSTARQHLARHLARFPTIASLIHQTLLRIRFQNKSVISEVAWYLSALHRLPLWASPGRRLLGWMLLPSLMAPYLFYPIIAWLYQLKTGQASGTHKLPLERL